MTDLYFYYPGVFTKHLQAKSSWLSEEELIKIRGVSILNLGALNFWSESNSRSIKKLKVALKSEKLFRGNS